MTPTKEDTSPEALRALASRLRGWLTAYYVADCVKYDDPLLLIPGVLDALAAEPTDAQVEAGVEVLRCGYGGAATSSVGLSYQIDSQRRLIRAVLEAARRAR